jgi:hypothetical protein
MARVRECLQACQVITTRVAFAGLSPMCEEILRAGLLQRRDIELIAPWTRLPLLCDEASLGLAEILFVELHGEALPPALRVLLVAAEPLKIVGMSADAKRATLFTLREQRTLMLGVTAARLWRPAGLED